MVILLDTTLLGKRLRELRKVNGFTQDYVVSVLGVIRQTYSHYESGRRTPNPEAIYKLAGLYNISADDLLYLSINIDESEYSEMSEPTKASEDLLAYLEYFSNPSNQKKYQYNTNLEKELLYYFQKISDDDKKEIIEFFKIKASKRTSR